MCMYKDVFDQRVMRAESLLQESLLQVACKVTCALPRDGGGGALMAFCLMSSHLIPNELRELVE